MVCHLRHVAEDIFFCDNTKQPPAGGERETHRQRAHMALVEGEAGRQALLEEERKRRRREVVVVFLLLASVASKLLNEQQY